MIIIALPNKVKKIKTLLNAKAKWCYLGKDVNKREKVTKILGQETRFYLKESLHNVAIQLSQPYLDFVAELGKGQKNQLNWWASKFASKSHFQMDFFLLFCYRILTLELIRQKNQGKNLVIFIEDPWLFEDIKNNYKADYVQYIGKVKLFLIKILLFIRGIVHRLLLVGWVFWARLLILYYHRGGRPEVLNKVKSAVMLINPAEKRAFREGCYVDNYMPGLPMFYKENGIDFFYLYLLNFPLSTAKLVGRNKEILWPLILDIRFFNVIKRVFKYWKPICNGNISNCTIKCDTSVLLQRQKWIEFSSVGFNMHLVLFDVLDSFFEKEWCDSVIYIFENQPWEKMLCMAAHKNNIKTFGYQHSSIWRLFLAQFIGKTEELFVPLPHKLITSGPYFAELYKKGNIPEHKIVVGGAWRFVDTAKNDEYNILEKKQIISKPIVLISIGIDVFIAQSMLRNVVQMISDNKLENEFTFWIKTHPGHTKYELNKLNKLVSRYHMVNKPFDKLKEDVDIVIYSTSTIGLEAFFYGKKVISYIPENLLAADPLFDMTDERIYRWFEGEDLKVDFLKNFHSNLDLKKIDLIKSRYFEEINRETWLSVITK